MTPIEGEAPAVKLTMDQKLKLAAAQRDSQKPTQTNTAAATAAAANTAAAITGGIGGALGGIKEGIGGALGGAKAVASKVKEPPIATAEPSGATVMARTRESSTWGAKSVTVFVFRSTAPAR